jgi:hypothetical protein
MTRKTTKRQKNDSPVPLELSRETTASEPVQPGETQGIPDKSREESTNVGHEASAKVEEHDPTPSSEPRRRQEDEESDHPLADNIVRSSINFIRHSRPS